MPIDQHYAFLTVAVAVVRCSTQVRAFIAATKPRLAAPGSVTSAALPPRGPNSNSATGDEEGDDLLGLVCACNN